MKRLVAGRATRVGLVLALLVLILSTLGLASARSARAATAHAAGKLAHGLPYGGTVAPAGPNALRTTSSANHHKPKRHKKRKHHKHRKRRKKLSLPTADLSLSTTSVPYSGGQVTFSYTASNASSCALGASPSLWTGANPAAVNCNGTYQVSLPATLEASQWTVTFTATGANGKVATSTQTLSQEAPAYQLSPNWSGYVAPSSTVFTDVSGVFTVPTLNCSQTPDAGESTWVGIGGGGSSAGDLLQTGIRSDCVGGVQYDNAAWWEEYPEVVEEDFFLFAVSPGDQISASVYETTSGQWETCLDDLTTGVTGLMVTGQSWGLTTGGCTGTYYPQGYTSYLGYSGGYTAEWIVEAYESCLGNSCSDLPLADYGTLTFSDLTTGPAGVSLPLSDSWAIVQNDSIVSTPSAVSNGSFSLSYTG